MLVLVLFAFIAGVITILSPCIFPVLPIILASSTTGSKRHAWGVVSGFICSFTFFTLFLSTLVRLTGVSADALRSLAVLVIAVLGLTLLIPRLQLFFEHAVSKLASWAGRRSAGGDMGFSGGILVGISLGLIWTPCVGPILASVIALALAGSVSGQAFFITLAYAVGTAIPMLLILWGGRQIFVRLPGLARHLGTIQKVFAVLMVLTAIGLHFNLDRRFQTYFLEKFPSYGAGLTRIEDNDLVRSQLNHMDEPSMVTLAPELIAGGEWFNSDPLTLESLRGKVVLVDFWTYSCINCIRTLPYLEDWYEKYKDQGFVIIGVHSPEFEFEKEADNVRKAIADFGITYPVVQDNDFATWNAYNNHYWPAKYFVDAKGELRFSHFGEGNYDESEQWIQDLLKEAGYQPEAAIDNVDYSLDAVTPETYVGYCQLQILR